MLLSTAMLLVGFVALIVGGELLVRGAVRLAERAGMSQLLIGLTIVGFGTSAPELVASVGAALQGHPDIAWGNVVGSNLANSLLILGVASLIYPMAVARGPLWRDGGLAAVMTFVLWLVASGNVGDGTLGRAMGGAFLALLFSYLVYAYRQEKLQGPLNTAVSDKAEALEGSDPDLHLQQPAAQSLLVLLGGIIAIGAGGHMLVTNAVDIAKAIGMSEAVIGVTVIAVGTSLPELVTAVIAARKGASAVALGNVLGSNIFNLLLIGGLTAVAAPSPIAPELLILNLPLLVFVSVLLMIFAATSRRISRVEGSMLLAIYVGLMALNLATV